jgi:eukaryotic translation initiation factor 2C
MKSGLSIYVTLFVDCRELLVDFYTSSNKRKPEHIIIFRYVTSELLSLHFSHLYFLILVVSMFNASRDGVSESQFNQVLNIELDQIIEACKLLDANWNPKFLLLVAQKNHHTKFFQPTSPENVPPGTIIDNKICHPKNNDFYLCAHAGMIVSFIYQLKTLFVNVCSSESF